MQVGGKHVLGTGLLLSMIATMLIPIAARTHVAMVIAMRVIMGMGMVSIKTFDIFDTVH